MQKRSILAGMSPTNEVAAATKCAHTEHIWCSKMGLTGFIRECSGGSNVSGAQRSCSLLNHCGSSGFARPSRVPSTTRLGAGCERELHTREVHTECDRRGSARARLPLELTRDFVTSGGRVPIRPCSMTASRRTAFRSFPLRYPRQHVIHLDSLRCAWHRARIFPARE